MTTPRFSIVLPLYNVAPYLDMCLNSLRAQSEGSWEGICVDDGSTDASGDYLLQHLREEPRLRVIFQPNQGPGAARNRALERVRGAYVGFLDGDDAIAPWWLKEAEKILRTHPVDLLQFAPLKLSKGPPAFHKATQQPTFITDPDALQAWGWRYFLIRGYMPMRLIRRTIACQVQFPVGVLQREDSIYGFLLLSHLTSVALTDASHYFYRKREQSLVSVRQDARIPCSILRALTHFPPPTTPHASKVMATFLIYTIVYWRWGRIPENRAVYRQVHALFLKAWDHLGFQLSRDYSVIRRVPTWFYLRFQWTLPTHLLSRLLQVYGYCRDRLRARHD